MEFELNTNTNLVENKIDTTISRVYRFKFEDEFVEILYRFAKLHQFDDRDTFKDAWNIWLEENDSVVTQEIERLSRLGYDGDIKDKMFKSARYYFRKKNTEKKEPAQRREYISVSKDLLEEMDRHINQNMNDSKYTPKDGFDMFCKENTTILKENITKICQSGVTDSIIIYNKMKKTYKNRYFMITKK